MADYEFFPKNKITDFNAPSPSGPKLSKHRSRSPINSASRGVSRVPPGVTARKMLLPRRRAVISLPTSAGTPRKRPAERNAQSGPPHPSGCITACRHLAREPP